ncbi:hypothetical protein E2C01_025991 [Portunus trituberculatus]|uniref:Uncharacterized protein n=1 Tax=Portunus trituberculatus TaxID=210409 RepID=A0A5B7EHN0_PORTR|nr:hypothetical protein [Portunus trituberculatus]
MDAKGTRLTIEHTLKPSLSPGSTSTAARPRYHSGVSLPLPSSQHSPRLTAVHPKRLTASYHHSSAAFVPLFRSAQGEGS